MTPALMEGVNNEEELLERMREKLDAFRDEFDREEELESFYQIYKRFLKERNKKIEWDKVELPKGKIVDYQELDQVEEPKAVLSKLAVLKLNGGLGTTMGCDGPKSMLSAKDGMNFIDMVIKHIKTISDKYDCKIPLILMNSFNTREKTAELIGENNWIRTFDQYKYLRISSETLMPIEEDKYCPPGHGQLLECIIQNGIMDELISDGKEYLFISNIDNLAASIDLNILNFLVKNKIDFGMEVTKKTKTDVKGGTLIDYEGELRLLEIAQVPTEKKKEFKKISKFKIFNTNSVWINLHALKRISSSPIELDIIKNEKTVNGESIIQLETAIGASIKYFENNCGILVPRSRFVPVKSCTDLFKLRSNLYVEEDGKVIPNKKRIGTELPSVRLLGDTFKHISTYEAAFAEEPDILDLDMLLVKGNVKFGKNVKLQGIVMIISEDGKSITVPDDSTLDDTLMLDGNITIDL